MANYKQPFNGTLVVINPQKKELTRTQKVQRYYNSNKGGIHSLLSMILLILVVVALYRISLGQSIPLFTDFLELLSSTPSLTIPSLTSTVVITPESLGFFSFLSPIISVLMSLVDLVVFLVNGIINLITFLFHFINWIFIRG